MTLYAYLLVLKWGTCDNVRKQTPICFTSHGTLVLNVTRQITHFQLYSLSRKLPVFEIFHDDLLRKGY